MCGIVGYLDLPGRAPGAPGPDLDAMLDAIVHRGPDDRGRLDEGPVHLGHARLSILDLSPAGHQPMRTPDGRHALVINGEIYNHAALRPALERDGVRFEGHCDAETVLHHLARHGARGLSDLRGMFALAFVDLERGEWLLARDRMGIKPLYYASASASSQGHDAFAFASEAKALLAGGVVDGGLDPQAVSHLLSFYVVPAPHCALPGVSALAPGELLRVAPDGTVQRERYADVAFGGTRELDEEEARTAVRAALEDAVASHLMSDVPVGVFLSGGVDSGAVALLAARASTREVPAFTLTFGEEGRELDEVEAAARVARHGGLPHHTKHVTGEDVLTALPAIVYAMDEPGASAIPNWFVAQLAREHGVKVCLSGLGGDELFAGYSRYVHLARRERAFDLWKSLPGLLKQGVRSGARLLGAAGRVASFLEKADLPFGERSFGYKLVLDDEGKRGLWRDPATFDRLGTTRDLLLPLFVPVLDEPVVNQVAYVDAKTYLANDLLRHMDGMTMAHGVEARVPLLDGPLVDLAFSLSPELRLRGEVRKHVLREAVRDLFPAGHLERPKMGFSLPMGAWMRAGPLRRVLDATLAGDVVERRGLFRTDAVARLLADFLAAPAGTPEAGMGETRVWTLVMLELWQRMFVDPGAPRASDVPLDALLEDR